MVKKCLICGKEFKAYSNNAKYCSYQCGDIAHRKYRAEERKKNRPIKPKACLKVKGETLCWTCQNATGGCSWSKWLIPVKGWKADETVLRNGHANNKIRKVKSFIIRECPEFIKDKRR